MSHRFRRLSFRRVSVVRAGRRVLDEVTGWIPADGITVVSGPSGPSGAGKTTLLRLCNRLEIPDHGSMCRLALGQPSRQAATPYVRAALRAALTPQIETTKGTGLVFLPGAMTGLILAGTPPLQAVLVQAVVMFLVLAATATITAVIALGLIRRLFTPDHRLVDLSAPADH
jgi:putative ABC transport system permease protein